MYIEDYRSLSERQLRFGIFEGLIRVFPKIWEPQNGWFIMENSIKMDDLGAPLFSETPRWCRNNNRPNRSFDSPFSKSQLLRTKIVVLNVR